MINLHHVKEGDRLRLQGGLVAEVTQNMGDGMWLEIRYLPGQAGVSADDVELCHAQDIVAVLDDPAKA